MFSKLKYLLGAMAVVFAVATPMPEANAQYYAGPNYYAGPQHHNPHYNGGWVQHAPPQPVYGIPHGVRRPGRFVCGQDVYTGAYNCVRRKKARFVRPMYYAPVPVYIGRPHHRHHPRYW